VGKVAARLRGHAHWVTCCALSGDGTRLLTGSADNTARLWRVGVPTPRAPGPVTLRIAAAASPEAPAAPAAAASKASRLGEARWHPGRTWRRKYG